MKTSKYIEIAAKIDAMIETGEYQPGAKLPTHRVLAQELGTTPATVAKAYNVLTEQGRIESQIGRGSFVCSNKELSQVISPEGASGDVNFSILQPCIDLEHMQLLDKHMQLANRSADRLELHSYVENSGLWHHREAGAEWNKSFGLNVGSVEQTLLVNGAQHAISTLVQLYTKPGDLVAVEAQTYPGILSVLGFMGRRFVGIDMDADGMLPESLDQACRAEKPAMVILVPSLQNPTGITMSAGRRQALAQVIQQHGIWLLEDDIYGFLNDEVIPPVTNFVPQLGFYVSSLSKALSPGLRCCYINAPQAEARHLANFIRAAVWLAPPVVFAAASSLIESGDALLLASRQRDIARRRCELARQIFSDEQMNKSLPASYHIWLQLPSRWNADDFCAAAKEQGLLVSSASFFNAQSGALHAVRVSVMAEPFEERFVKGLEALAALVEQQHYRHMHF